MQKVKFELRHNWDTNLESRISPVKLTWIERRAIENKPYFIVDFGLDFTAKDYAKMRYAVDIGKSLGILKHEDRDFTLKMIRRAKIRAMKEYNSGTRDSELRILKMYMNGDILSI